MIDMRVCERVLYECVCVCLCVCAMCVCERVYVCAQETVCVMAECDV